MSSVFDPQAFLNATVSESNEKRPPLPTEAPDSLGGLYTAIIDKVDPKTGEKDGKSWLQMAVTLKLEVPPTLQDSMKFGPTITLTDRVFIDITESGTIDNAPGRNRGQRLYREACDLNKPGDVFAWSMVVGRPVKVKINHEVYNNEVQERIGGVFKL